MWEPHIPIEVKKPAVMKKVKFTMHTNPDLQAFLEIAIDNLKHERLAS